MMGTAVVAVAVATVWTDPSRPRPVDGPSLTDPVDIRAWLAGMSLADRRALSAADLTQTQALYGDRVAILDETDGWAHVAVLDQPTPKHRHGYPGWVPRTQLIADTEVADLLDRGPVAVVDGAATTWLFNDADLRERDTEVSIGTRLPVLDTAEHAVRVATPGRGGKWLPTAVTTVYRSVGATADPTGELLTTVAGRMLGRPYLWGGRSGFAVDCSGLTSLAYRVAGVTIPRDADAQARHRAGHAVARDDLHPGDLLFYTAGPGRSTIRHVAMAAGDDRMIEASGTVGVRVTRVRGGADYWGATRVLRS